jgi:hypothetical protein
MAYLAADTSAELTDPARRRRAPLLAGWTRTR